MKDKGLAVILMLFVFGHPVFAQQEDCEGTNEFKIGIENAATAASPGNWGVASSATVVLSVMFGLLLSCLRLPSDPNSRWTSLPSG